MCCLEISEASQTNSPYRGIQVQYSDFHLISCNLWVTLFTCTKYLHCNSFNKKKLYLEFTLMVFHKAFTWLLYFSSNPCPELLTHSILSESVRSHVLYKPFKYIFIWFTSLYISTCFFYSTSFLLILLLPYFHII